MAKGTKKGQPAIDDKKAGKPNKQSDKKVEPKPPPCPETKNGALLACHVSDIEKPARCVLYFAPIERPPPPPPAPSLVSDQPPSTLVSENPPEGIVIEPEERPPPRYVILRKENSQELLQPETIIAIDLRDNQQTRNVVNAFEPKAIVSLLS